MSDDPNEIDRALGNMPLSPKPKKAATPPRKEYFRCRCGCRFLTHWTHCPACGEAKPKE